MGSYLSKIYSCSQGTISVQEGVLLEHLATFENSESRNFMKIASPYS